MGEIGIRELGESLLAVERTVNSQQSTVNSQSVLAVEPTVLRQPAHQAPGAASNSTRLDALAAPAGVARVVAAFEGATRMAQKAKSVAPLPLPPEARVITAGGRGKKGSADGNSKAVGLRHGKVVAVVKPPAKRWHSLLGAYSSSTSPDTCMVHDR